MKRIAACLLAVVLIFGTVISASAEISPTASVADKYLIVDATPVPSGGGKTTPPVTNPDRILVGSGDTSTLVAVPNTGYRFVEWRIEGGTFDVVSGSRTTTTLVIRPTGDENIHAYAYFATNAQLAVEAVGETGGDAAVNPDKTNDSHYEVFQVGEIATVVAHPSEGYRFVRWILNNGTYDTVVGDLSFSTIVLKPTTDCKFTAYFEKVPANKKPITVIVPDDRGGSAITNQTVVYEGDVIKLWANPDGGFDFGGWVIPGRFEIIEGDLNSPYIIIRPIGDDPIIATPVFVEKKTPSKDPVSPVTGEQPIICYSVGTALLAVAAYAVLVAVKKKQNNA